MNRIKKGTENRILRMTALLMAVLLCAGMPQAALTGRASNTLGSQGSTMTEGGEGQEAPAEGVADGEVEAIISENDEGAASSTVSEVRIKETNGVRVRAEASTSSTQVGALKKDVVIAVVGETTGSDGMVWYQISGQSEGKQVDGYVRSDLVEVTATAQPEPSEAPVDAPEDTSADVPADTGMPSSNEYDVAYALDDNTGANDWFLNDNINGNRYKISELLGAAQTNENNIDVMEKQTKTLRTIIIILAVVIALLMVVVTMMIFKLRNSGDYDGDDDYDDYGDDDEDEDDDEEDEDDEDGEDDYVPARRQGSVRISQRRSTGRRYDEDDDEEEDEDDEDDDDHYSGRSSRRESSGRRASQTSRARSPRGSRARNFLDVEEDDEMDFEFLDLK